MGPLFEKPFDPTPPSILNSVLNDDSGSVRCVSFSCDYIISICYLLKSALTHELGLLHAVCVWRLHTLGVKN